MSEWHEVIANLMTHIRRGARVADVSIEEEFDNLIEMDGSSSGKRLILRLSTKAEEEE